MTNVRISKGKFDGITALADERGVIAATALDQRGSLKKAIAQARDGSPETATEDLTRFKIAVARVLTKYASGILLDPEYGLPALQSKNPHTGVLLAYEESGYDATDKGRRPSLLPGWSVRRLIAAGANAIKILLYYNPFDTEPINAIKHAFVERAGAECVANDVPFFLEIVTYDDAVGDSDGIEFAKEKPEHVTRATAEFSKAPYGIDVLKVEVPFNMTFVEGTRAFGGTTVYTRNDAMRLFREAASVATKPFIYLSAGVSDGVFRESLELAGESGVNYAGVLCGRATWQDGVPIFAREGESALLAWLEDRGVQNIKALNELLLKGAKPWWTVYGEKEDVEIVER
jgi:tagatose 1,6-diphosphate aldolase